MKPIEMLQELQTWLTFTNDEMEKALAAKSNPNFKSFVWQWGNGVYDEDINQAKSDFLNSLK